MVFPLIFVSYQAVLLTFQLSVGVVKMFHFQNKVDSCTKLVFSTETGQVLKSLGLFELGRTVKSFRCINFFEQIFTDLPKKQELLRALSLILMDNWLIIDKQVMFFFKIVCMPVIYYTMRPYFQYMYDCYIVKETCEMTLSM